MMDNDRRPPTADSRSATSNVDLHIGELVLTGFDGVDGAGVGAIVQQELTRLFAERGVPAGLRQDAVTSAMDAGAITLPADADAYTLGAHIAGQIYGGLRE